MSSTPSLFAFIANGPLCAEDAMADKSFASRVIWDAQSKRSINDPAVLPIYQSAGWVFRSLDEVDAVYEGRQPGTIYGGSGVPDHQALEALVSSLHGSEDTVVTAAGMSAFTATIISLAKSGDRIVAARDLYGNTSRLLDDLRKFGVTTDTFDASDPASVTDALRSSARLVIVETISNPRVRVADLTAVCRAAHECGALVIVDNSLASPYHCQPVRFGADLVIESITKFLGGHMDLTLGSVSGPASLLGPIRLLAARLGLISATLDAWLAIRSIATLDVRLARSSANAGEVASWLASHSKVRAVHYPGLATHATHSLAKGVLERGYGSVVSFELEPDRRLVDRLLAALAHIKLVLSFAGVSTSLSHPATSSHRSLTADQRRAIGIHDGFLRLSVGVENPADIIGDLARGLAAV